MRNEEETGTVEIWLSWACWGSAVFLAPAETGNLGGSYHPWVRGPPGNLGST